MSANNITTEHAASFLKNVVRWIFTIVGVVLLVRLAMTLFNLAFNFSDTPVGRLINEGAFAERIDDLSPGRIAVQVVIIVVIATILIISKKTEK